MQAITGIVAPCREMWLKTGWTAGNSWLIN